jgi:nucleotide-binding universal stress UspA family protein
MAEICPVVNTERLLVATDGSEFSEDAIREALALSRRCSSKLFAISVIETNAELAAMAPALLEKNEKAARARLEAVAVRARKDGVDCETIVREGEDLYQYIVDEAVKNKITMIVMGRRGRKGLNRLVMGSTTARVIGLAPCSVLVVPPATDGSKYSAAAVSEAIGIAKRNGSKLTAVAVVPAEMAMPTDADFAALQRDKLADQEMQSAEKNAKAVKEAAQKEGVAAQAFVLSGKPADAIIECAKDANADLITVGSHGRTGLDKLLMGSVTERVIVLSPCAVLVVKRQP